MKSDAKMSAKTLALGAILTALVVILQFMGSFIHLGMFSISLVLIPIVIGAAVCGPIVGGWLGFVFAIVVIATGGANLFFAFSVHGTIITVLGKGIACGFASGLAYKALKCFNKTVAAIVAAIACPIVNTGIFLLGSAVFFMPFASQIGDLLGMPQAGFELF